MKTKNQAYITAFGQNFKKLLESKKKTPEEVAAHGNIETKQVYRVINGEHAATLSVIYALAKGLDVHPKELFDFGFTG
ncbi:MAG: helix-turn-helix transcriptional regulator [Chitinophaga sp.]|uniref:helix-turn-helix domain-containing protein n=1 Tax=Chitinophaga sp. TaxID=1869181 RepID=UPI001B02C1EC|nr:helix-turn-helix transcriptional regulator [Chitinophaga sp.]MBO9728404.1 helix-turn-helix transcriptional regulator [Chitinophaga sp.]